MGYKPKIYAPSNYRELAAYEKEKKRGGKVRLKGAFGEPLYIEKSATDAPDNPRLQRIHTLKLQRAREKIKKVREEQKKKKKANEYTEALSARA